MTDSNAQPYNIQDNDSYLSLQRKDSSNIITMAGRTEDTDGFKDEGGGGEDAAARSQKGKRRRSDKLPVSSWAASASLVVEDAMPLRAFSRPLWRTLFRPLLRRFALLEHTLTSSRPFVILERVLSLPRTIPFLLSLGLIGMQVRRLWRTQRDALVMALVTLAQIKGTVRCLAEVDAGGLRQSVNEGGELKVREAGGGWQDDDEGSTGRSETESEARRWLAYWTVFAAFSFLETIYVSPGARDNASSTGSSSLLVRMRAHLSTLLRWAAQNLPERVRPRVPPPPRKPFLEPQPFPEASLRSTGLDASTSSIRSPARLPLPEAIFGANSTFYLAFKIISLNWASSERSRGGEAIWDIFLRPFLGSAGLAHDASRTGRKRRRLRVFVVPESAAPTTDSLIRSPAGNQVVEAQPPSASIISPPKTPPLSSTGSLPPRRTRSAPLPASSGCSALHTEPAFVRHGISEEDEPSQKEHRDAAEVMAEWAASEGNGHWETLGGSALGGSDRTRQAGGLVAEVHG